MLCNLDIDVSLATVPLVVMQPVELAGIVSRTWDALRLWIK